jgi:hypothetical protein
MGGYVGSGGAARGAVTGGRSGVVTGGAASAAAASAATACRGRRLNDAADRRRGSTSSARASSRASSWIGEVPVGEEGGGAGVFIPPPFSPGWWLQLGLKGFWAAVPVPALAPP